GVMGLSPSQAGLSLVVLMVALNTSAGLAGQVLGRVRHYKLLPLLALLLSTVAVAMLAWRAPSMTPLSFEFTLIAIGVGFGPLPNSRRNNAMRTTRRSPTLARGCDRLRPPSTQPPRRRAIPSRALWIFPTPMGHAQIFGVQKKVASGLGDREVPSFADENAVCQLAKPGAVAPAMLFNGRRGSANLSGRPKQ